MSFEVDVSTSIDESNWNKNLVKNRGATAYQIPNYSYVYSQTFDSKPFFVYVRHKGEIVGQLSAIIHTKYNWKATNFISKFLGSNLNLNKVLRWEYGPIIHDHSHHEEIL